LLVTYKNQLPADIRFGDIVTDSRGRTFEVRSDVEFDRGDWHLTGYLISDPAETNWRKLGTIPQSFTIDGNSLVTISYEDDEAA